MADSSRGSAPRSSTSASRSHQSTSEPLEPSFIMPTMRDSVQESLLRDSQPRKRRARESLARSQRGTKDIASPPTRHKKLSTRENHQARHRAPGENTVGPGHYISLLWNNFVQPLVQYVLEVVWYAMNNHLKPLVALAFSIFLIASAIQYSSGVMQYYMQTALAPICIVPGSSYLLPFCSTSRAAAPYKSQRPDFEELVNVQSSFEDVLEATKDSHALPATLEKSKMAVRDLRTLVKFSHLPSRSELEVELSSFIETAGEASHQLSKYNAKIGQAMDIVITTNRWTVNELQGIEATRELDAGSFSRALAYMNPWGAHTAEQKSDEQVFDQYVKHVGTVKENIEALVQRSIALLQLLNHLENQLEVIAEIGIRDDMIVSRDHDELLGQLWTILGGNRSSKKAGEDALWLLRQVQAYRKDAMEHVSATLLKLREIAAELENLRDGVAAPEVVGYGKVPLSFHIELVEKSIERLKNSRGEARSLEQDQIRKGLNAGDDEPSGSGRLELPAGKSKPATVYAT
jgi:hypothetical protein